MLTTALVFFPIAMWCVTTPEHKDSKEADIPLKCFVVDYEGESFTSRLSCEDWIGDVINQVNDNNRLYNVTFHNPTTVFECISSAEIDQLRKQLDAGPYKES